MVTTTTPTEAIYANGASIFFVGYSLFQVPSNLILLRLGGRVWLSVMLVAWGLAATAFAGMQRPVEFYVLRFLLGLAECGTFPGMWYHLSLFYDSAHMGRSRHAGLIACHRCLVHLCAACFHMSPDTQVLHMALLLQQW